MTSIQSARDRLSSLSSHIMGSSSPSVFTAATVAAAPEDPLFGLMKAYREDPSDKKVDLGIGAYRDNNAKPWILPVVKKVAIRLYTSIFIQLSNIYIYRPMTPSTTIPPSITNTSLSVVSQSSPPQLRN